MGAEEGTHHGNQAGTLLPGHITVPDRPALALSSFYLGLAKCRALPNTI